MIEEHNNKDLVDLFYDHYWAVRDLVPNNPMVSGLRMGYPIDETEKSILGIELRFKVTEAFDEYFPGYDIILICIADQRADNKEKYIESQKIFLGRVWKENRRSFEAIVLCLEDLGFYDILLNGIRERIIKEI